MLSSFASAGSAGSTALSTDSDSRGGWGAACATGLHARCWLPFAAAFPETAVVASQIPPWLGRVLARDFFRVHLAYFLVATLVGGAIVTRLEALPFLDAWVLTSGAMTGASLVPFDVARLHTGSQVVCWFLMTFGGLTFTSLWVIGYRVYTFRSRLSKSLRRCAKLAQELRRANKARLPRAGMEARPERPVAGVGSVASARAVLEAIDAEDTLLSELTAQDEGLMAVAVLTAAYTLFWHIITPCALYSSLHRAHLAGRDPLLWEQLGARGINLGWLCLFMSTSAFNNVGLSILSNSTAEFADNTPALLTLCAAILAGNTAWPPALRFMLRCVAALGARAPWLVRPSWRRGCRYALHDPQRVYHLLFPARETWALFTALMATNLVQLAVVLGSSASSSALRPPGSPVSHAGYSAFFVVVNTRSAGFTSFDLNALAPVCLVVFALAMWWSPFPLVAVWSHARAPQGTLTQFIAPDPHALRPPGAAPLPRAASKRYTLDFPVLRQFTKMYLLRHGVWICLAFIAIAAADGILLVPSTPGGAPPTSLFAFMFEVLSAYGCNGMSLGWPGESFTYSLCAKFTAFSKLVIIFMMHLGRHRSMPRKVDPPLAARVARAEALVEAAKAELAALSGGAHSSGGSFLGSFFGLGSFPGSVEVGTLRAAISLIRGHSASNLASVSELAALAEGGEEEGAGGSVSGKADVVTLSIGDDTAEPPAETELVPIGGMG